MALEETITTAPLIAQWQDSVLSVQQESHFSRHDPYQLSEAKLHLFYEGGILTQLPSHPTILDYGADKGVLGVMLAVRLEASSLVQADRQDRRLPAIKAVTQFVKAPHNGMPQTDETFDVILLSDVLHFITKDKRLYFLNSLAQHHLNPGGRIIVLEYNSSFHEDMKDLGQLLDREKPADKFLQPVTLVIGEEPAPTDWKPTVVFTVRQRR